MVCVLNSAEYGSSSLFYSSVTAQLLPESLRLLLDLYFHLFFFLLVNRLKAAVCISCSWEVFFVVVFVFDSLITGMNYGNIAVMVSRTDHRLRLCRDKRDLFYTPKVEKTLFH